MGKGKAKGKPGGGKPGPKPAAGNKTPIAAKLSSVEMASGKLFWPSSDKSSDGGKTWRLMFAGRTITMEREWNKRDVPEALRYQGVVEVKHQIVVRFDDITDIFFDAAGGGGFVQFELGVDLNVRKGVRKSSLAKLGAAKGGAGGITKTEWSKEETPFSSFGGTRVLTFRTKKGGSPVGFSNAIQKMLAFNPALKALADARSTPIRLVDAWVQGYSNRIVSSSSVVAAVAPREAVTGTVIAKSATAAATPVASAAATVAGENGKRGAEQDAGGGVNKRARRGDRGAGEKAGATSDAVAGAGSGEGAGAGALLALASTRAGASASARSPL